VFDGILETLFVNLTVLMFIKEKGIIWEEIEVVESLTEVICVKSSSEGKFPLKKPLT
jgi:hypothetical protein